MKNNYNFPVELQPIYLDGGKKISNQKAVVRMDTLESLGIVSDDYGLVKHGTVVDSFREAAKGFEFTEKITVTHNGAYMFYQMAFPKIQVEVAPGDLVQMMILAKNSYNGWSSLQIILGAFRLVCSNGMIIGEQFLRFNLRHTLAINNQNIIDQYKDASINYMTLFEEKGLTIQAMSKVALPDPERAFSKDIIALPEYLRKEAVLSFEDGKDHSVWGYYNSLTYAITHKMKKESPDRAIVYGKEAWRATEAILV